MGLTHTPYTCIGERGKREIKHEEERERVVCSERKR